MAITVPSSPTTGTAYDTGSNGVTINKPSSLQDGDVLYALIGKDWDSGSGIWACAGWTRIAEQSTTAGRNAESAILRKVLPDAGSEPVSYTFTNGDTDIRVIVGTIIPVRGADTSTPEDQTTTEANGVDNDNPDSPSIATNTDGALVIPVSFLASTQNSGYVIWSPPTSYTIAGPAQHEDGGFVRIAEIAGAYLVKAGAGATGAISWNNTANDGLAEYHTYTVAVKPSAESPSASPSVSPSVSPSESASLSPSSSVSPSESASESASVSPSEEEVISGEVTWGHDTGVLEANVRDFIGNWTGTGAISGAGDAETLDLETTENMVSEVVNTGAYTVTLLQNEYDGTGDDVNMDYRHGNSKENCEGAGWNDYTVSFESLGYVQIRMTSTL